jgi:thiamine kinase-like enzyme
VLVDWSHAALGDPAFDLAALFIRARADGADGRRLKQLVEDLAEPGSWESMLALATGMLREVSRGERERPSDSLSAQRSRYSRAGIDLLQEALS